MPDNDGQTPPTNSNPPSNQNPPANPPGNGDGGNKDNSQADAVKMAEKMGRLEKELEGYKEYTNRVDPVLQTLWGDETLMNQLLDVHNKRLGVPPADNNQPQKPDNNNQPPAIDPMNADTRATVVGQITEDFEKDYGLSDLKKNNKENYQKVVGKVMSELKEMLDPNDNKTIQQVMKDVPARKLRNFLDRALIYAKRDDEIKSVFDDIDVADNQGIIGSIPSNASYNPNEVSLTPKEKEVARKMRIPEEKFLENKKKILARNNEEP